MLRFHVLLASAISAFGAGLSSAQSLNWVEAQVPVAPSARCCSGLDYDFASSGAVLFGGLIGPYDYLGDTWVWRNGWHQEFPATSPAPREGPGMVWDGAAQNTVLFGGTLSSGENRPGVFSDETWIWDGANWTEQFPSVSPPGRQFDLPGMTYDAATRTVLMFGGSSAAGGYFLNDTWTWDGISKTWTQQIPQTSPSPRKTMVAYDYRNRNVVLFGGRNNGGNFNDTWTWDGTNWKQLFPATSPPDTALGSLAYDAKIGLVILLSGSQTWAWNGITWTRLGPLTPPPGNPSQPMAYDPRSSGLLLFSASGETWFFVRNP